jgi:hypothetical protein
MKQKDFTALPSLEKLEHAYQIAAKVVSLYGDAYLPIFERLHLDLEDQKKNRDLKRIALDTASAYNI